MRFNESRIMISSRLIQTGVILRGLQLFFRAQLDSHSPFYFSMAAQARGNSFVYKRLPFFLSFLPIFKTPRLHSKTS